jgi:hypothetical protein
LDTQRNGEHGKAWHVSVSSFEGSPYQTLAVNILGHVDIRVTQNVAQKLTSCALAQDWNAWYGSSENALIVD